MPETNQVCESVSTNHEPDCATRYQLISHHCGHLTLCGVRVACTIVVCSSRVSRFWPKRARAASTDPTG